MKPVIFLQEVKAELTKVIWPTRREAINLTIMVIAVSLIVGLYVGGLDFLLTNAMNILIKK